MARKKNRKELDEESLKKIYTGKNFVPPTDKELETIKEHECESSTDENQVYWHVFGSSCLMTYGPNSNLHSCLVNFHNYI